MSVGQEVVVVSHDCASIAPLGDVQGGLVDRYAWDSHKWQDDCTDRKKETIVSFRSGAPLLAASIVVVVGFLVREDFKPSDANTQESDIYQVMVAGVADLSSFWR